MHENGAEGTAMRSDRPAARHRAAAGTGRRAPGHETRPDLLTPRGFAIACFVALLGVLTFCVLAAGGALNEQASIVLDDTGQLLGGVAAAVCGALSWRRARSPDRAWRLLLAFGTAGWTGGVVIWSWYQIVVGHDLPSPSLADVGFFTLPLFLLPALMLFPARPRPVDVAPPGRAGKPPYVRLILVLDSLVVVGSLFTLTWSTALGVAIRTHDHDLLLLLIAFGYPITDLLMVVFVVLLGTFRAPRNPRALLLLGLGLVAISVSDSFFTWLVSIDAPAMPPIFDVGFVAGPVLLALSALAPGPAEPRRQPDSQPRAPDRGVVFLPYVPLTLTGLVLAVQLALGRRIDPVEAALGLTLVAVVVGRQLVTLLDNVNLLRQVRDGQDRLRRQAYTDSLTDLANRALFGEELDVEVRAHHAGRPMALLFCDLDDFKFVNDRYGHAVGDELLRGVADRLRAEALSRDTVARLGGDEFAVLLRDGDGRDLGHTDELAQRLLDSLIRPYRLQVSHGEATPTELSVEVGASIGLVILDAATPPLSPDALLARVDAAMYSAKRRGKNRLITFRGAQVGQDEEPALLGELRLAIATATRVQPAGRSDPPEALEAGRIDVMYQPVVEFGTSRVAAVEALVRWRHPRHGVLPAGMLISAADETGVLGELEEHVLLTACRDVGRLRADWGLPDLAVHVNISATRAGDARLVGTVREALLRHRLPGGALVLEITETSRVPDLDAAAEVLRRIRQLDVRVALDDFGTGYSGLSYLLELPIDIVKLDRSLTVAEPESRGGTIRQAAAALTLGLGLDLVAEGVETDRQAAQLADLGCRFGQGFLWSRPAFLPELDLTRPALLSH